MAEIRAAAVTLSPVVTDLIVALLSARLKTTVVACFEHRSGIDTSLMAASPDLIFLGVRPDEDARIAGNLLQLVPHAKVIALTSDGRVATVHAANAAQVVLRDFSPQQLIDSILGPMDNEV